jgi:hypothetical protein
MSNLSPERAHISDMEARALAAERALHIADQMLVSRGHALQSALAEIEKLKRPAEPAQQQALLGLATTGQLLAELTARAEIHGWARYRTVDSEAEQPAQGPGGL